jgi:hypothetical protein
VSGARVRTFLLAPVGQRPGPLALRAGWPGFWAVTRHEDVKALSRDTALFSSRPAIMIDDGSSPAGTSIARRRKAFSNTLSSGLLIRGLGVRVPGGAPVLTWGYARLGIPCEGRFRPVFAPRLFVSPDLIVWVGRYAL